MQSALEHYEKAAYFWENKQLNEAISELKKSLELEPNYPDALFNLGCIYGVMNRYEEAFEKFRLLLQINPNDAVTYKYVGKLFRQKAQSNQTEEDWRSSEQALQQSLLLEPSDANTLDELSEVLYELKDFKAAVNTSISAALMAPNDRRIVYNRDARCARVMRKYMSIGKWKDAWQVWRMVLDSRKLK